MQLANSLTKEVRTVCEELSSLQNTQTSVLHAISDNQSVLQQVANSMSAEVQSNTSVLSIDDNASQQLNATTQNNVEILALIRNLQSEIVQLHNNLGNNRNNGGGRSRNNNYRRSSGTRNNRRNTNNGAIQPTQNFQNPQSGQPAQYVPNIQPLPGFQNSLSYNQENPQQQQVQRSWWKYCWTQGVCGHNSNECSPGKGDINCRQQKIIEWVEPIIITGGLDF